MVAAGSGVRLGGSVPKALRTVGGRALVSHAVELMAQAGAEQVVVTVPLDHQAAFADVLATASVPTTVIVGGLERQDSVRLGLTRLRQQGAAEHAVVLVHDAARPLVPQDTARAVVDAVRAGAAAVIPVVAVTDSIRHVDDHGSAVVDRSTLRAVQTPQGFRLAELIAAHEIVAERGLTVTDDAAVCEAVGHRVTLVAGSRDGLKVTEPSDLLVAESVWRHRAESRAVENARLG